MMDKYLRKAKPLLVKILRFKVLIISLVILGILGFTIQQAQKIGDDLVDQQLDRKSVV